MADYKAAIKRVLLTEGGYANDPDDAGGETYKGVARKFWPKWVGWVIVDRLRGQPNFPHNLKGNITLDEYVMLFYKTNFWDKIGGDFIDDQEIGNNLIDAAVNEGIKGAVKRAQSIVGLAPTGIETPELIEKLNSMI